MLRILQISPLFIYFFFFNDTATTEIYTLSLHDALPIWLIPLLAAVRVGLPATTKFRRGTSPIKSRAAAPTTAILESCSRRLRRSEEHTSELQSPCNLVCRLLLEKKRNTVTV